MRHRNRVVMAGIGLLWRWLGTASSFALFGIGSLVLSMTVLPLMALCIRDPGYRLRSIRRVVGAAMRGFVIYMRVVGVLRYRIEGLEHVNREQGYLILANHPSLIDVVFLLAHFPMANCVIKGGLLENFFVRRLLRWADYIPNTDTGSFMGESVERLKAGDSLILFPEGTRTERGQPMDFKVGAAAIAVRSESLCLPVLICCEPSTLTKSDRWYQVPPQRVFFSMNIQKPLTAAEIIGDESQTRGAARRFNEFLLQYFISGLNAFENTPRSAPHQVRHAGARRREVS